MDKNNTIDEVSFVAIHPGEVLESELEARGIPPKEFARRIGLSPSLLNEFIKGKRNLTQTLAISLEEQLGISKESWYRIYAEYIYTSSVLGMRKLVMAKERKERKYNKTMAVNI